MSRYLKKTMSTLSVLDLGDLVEEVDDEEEEISTSTQLGAAVKVLGAVKKFRTHLQRKQACKLQAEERLPQSLEHDCDTYTDLVRTRPSLRSSPRAWGRPLALPQPLSRCSQQPRSRVHRLRAPV